MFTFAYYPLLLFLIPVLYLAIREFRKKPSAFSYSLAEKISKTFPFDSSSLPLRLPLTLKTMGLVLLVLALARPQISNVSRETLSSGVDIMLCLDTSGSMQAMDFKIDGKQVNRLDAVKKVVNEFIEKRKSDRIGLVVFGEDAYTQSPLTLDKGLLLGLVKKLKIGMAGDSTAIGSAIAIGGKRLKELKAKTRLLILLTDGRSNSGSLSPEQAAEAVKVFGIKIYTIGVGGKGPAPFPVDTFFGKRMVNQMVDLDEDTLRKVAQIGGGKFFLAANSKQLAEIYSIIDKEEKTEIKIKEFFHFTELFRYFLVAALLFFVSEIIIKAFVFRVIP
jgi:Ca-activated chloride channel family protein